MGVLRERGAHHGRLALPEQLAEDGPEGPHRLLLLLDVHGPAAVEDGVKARQIVLVVDATRREHVNHRRGEKHRGGSNVRAEGNAEAAPRAM